MTGRSAKPPLLVLGVWILLTFLGSSLFLGAVRPLAQAGLGLGVIVGCALAYRVPNHGLRPAGVALRVAGAGLVLMLTLSVGLVPVPMGIARIVAPGLALARPDAAWWTLATDPSQVPEQMATVALLTGFGALVAVWVAGRFPKDGGEAAITTVTALVAVCGILHGAAGATSVLGLITPQGAPSPFFAPFVNPDHAGAAMLLGGPVAVGMALNTEQPRWNRGLAWVVAALAGILLVLVDSVGGMVVTVLITVMWAWRRSSVRPLAALGVAGIAGLVHLVTRGGGWVHGSVAARAGVWGDALRMLSQYWLAGTGGGTFKQAIRAYRSDFAFASFAHAHSDPLEWLVTTGLIGLVGGAVAVIVLRPLPVAPTRRRDGMVFGLLALALYAFVDFPLQIPTIAMAALAVLACAIVAYGPPRSVETRWVRGLLIGIALFEVPAVLIQLRQAGIEWGRAAVGDFARDPAAAAQGAHALALLLDTGAEGQLYAAWAAQAAKDSEGAVTTALAIRDRYPDDPDALRSAATILAHEHRYEEATALLERSEARDPSDYRSWVVLAHVAHAQGDNLLAAQRWTEAFRRSGPGLEEAYAELPVGVYWVQALEPVDAQYSAALAYLLFRKGDLETALLAIEQAARLDPVADGDDLLRSTILVQVGRPALAEDWLRDMLVRRPGDPKVLAAYGDVLTALGRHDDATAAFLEGATTSPALRIRALQSAESGGGPKAALELSRRFEVDGTMDPDLALQVAATHERAGDPRGCIDEIQRWDLLSGSVASNAATLLESCRAMPR